jgi:hypothetical protein
MSDAVRRIGTLDDADGDSLIIGVDRDRMTVGDGLYVVASLDSRARAEFHALWVAAIVAIDEYKAAHPEASDG